MVRNLLVRPSTTTTLDGERPLGRDRGVRRGGLVWILGAVAGLAACDSANQRTDTPRTHEADSPSATTATAGPSAELTPMVRAQWAALVGRPPPTTFVDDDEKRFYATCLPFTKSLNDHVERLSAQGLLGTAQPSDPEARLLGVEAVRQHPPPMSPAALEWCAGYATRGFRAELGTARAEEEEGLLQAMAGAMVAAFDRTGKLCPATTEPVPAELAQITTGPYQPKAEDWDSPTWRCLHFRWLRPLRCQHELETAKTEFTFIARGDMTDEGRIDEYRLTGTVRAGSIELGPVTGRFLHPPLPSDGGAASATSPPATPATPAPHESSEP